MGGETTKESWFSSLWWTSSKKGSGDEAFLGILAFEVASLMLKVVTLWHCLSDKEVLRLREEVVNSAGVRKLVSEGDDYLMELATNEILENFRFLAKSVARLGKRCIDPLYHHFDQFVDDPVRTRFQWSGWEYRGKKMERKVKKMERFVTSMSQLSQELEVLAELEQTLRRMQVISVLNRPELHEFRLKLMLQRQEVKNLKGSSPWNRTYDYIVRLLVRSLFTILARMRLVFGSNCVPTEEGKVNFLPRSLSFSPLMHASVHPSDNDPPGFYSKPPGRQFLMQALVADKGRRKKQQRQALSRRLESDQLANLGSFKDCMLSRNDSPAIGSCGGSMRLSSFNMRNAAKTKLADAMSCSCSSTVYAKLSIKDPLLRPPPSTLGDAALALHYANVVILIERMVSSPHSIQPKTRDDLYNMLPSSIRTALRSRLKLYSKTEVPFILDASLSAEWSVKLMRILEWLAPLARDMIRWHSERNFEEKLTASKMNVFLVQTLHFANQAKTEAAIVELLVGLNCICRISRELGLQDESDSSPSRALCGF